LASAVVTATALVEHGYSITWSARTKSDWGNRQPERLGGLEIYD
jgi:hypothetical protein